MFVGRVRGNLTATLKHEALKGTRLLWVERDGGRVLAVDTVDAGPGDLVLVMEEGNGAAQVLGRPRGPIRSVIVGVVDSVDRDERAVGTAGRGGAGIGARAAGKACPEAS